jgi:Trypsin-like peptidase domain
MYRSFCIALFTGLAATVAVAQNGPQVSSTGNPSVAPLKWVGMVINPTPTKDDPNLVAACTGQFIKPNIVLTAAHCVKDVVDNPTGPWFDLTKQVFVLQYQNGEGSHTFKTVCAATPPGWQVPADFVTLKITQKNRAQRAASGHDFALILVDGTSPTGVMPYALDWKGKVTDAVRVGYAADILDGEIIQQAEGIVFFANAIPMFPEAPTNLVVHWQSITDLTQGSSGGAWIANYSSQETQDKNVLVAVTSFNDTGYPGAIMGAYLTAAEFNPLLNFVSNGCK